MEKISRIILVFVTVIVLAISLPNFYWIIFEKSVREPFVLYSCVNHDFMIFRAKEKLWQDSKKNLYTRDDYEQKLPLFFFKQLSSSGILPDSVNNLPLDMRSLAREKSFFRLRANEIDTPGPELFPLFESRSGRAVLEWPKDCFRITWRVEFIEAATNKILEEKSQMFSAALYHKGFIFPAKKISGIPTTRKTCDEGYFLVDSKYQLFHLKMILGKPYVKKVDIPEGLKIKHISCVDFKNKVFYAYLFSEKNEIFILTQKDYTFIKWPVDGYNSTNCDLKIYGDLFNYTVVIEGYDWVKAFALDKKYQLVSSYAEKWPVKEDLITGKIFASIFPGQLSMTSEYSKFIRFYFTPSNGLNWVFLNLLLLAFHFSWLYWHKKRMKNHIADLGIVAVFGIYGFIAIHFFRNKFFD